MAFPRSVAALLRASVATTGPSPAEVVGHRPPEAFEGLAEAARFHGVPGYVYRAVVTCGGIPLPELGLLRDLRRETVRRHLRTIGDLRFLARVLDGAGIPWIVFKGPALAAPVHGSPELRSYSDLDVLVPAVRFGEAAERLEEAGCQVPEHDWRYLREGLKGEIDVFMPSGTHLDLHWHLINEIPTRQPYRIDLDGLFARRRMVTIGDDDVPTLSHQDTTVYVALHAMLSPRQRLVGMKDLHLLIDGSPWPLEELLAHARGWGADLPFRTALLQMQRSIGPPARSPLAPRTGAGLLWDLTARTASRLSPLERQDGGPSFGRLVSRSVRGDQKASLGLLVRNTGIVASQGIRGTRGASENADSTSAGQSDARPASSVERARFFAAVAGQPGTISG